MMYKINSTSISKVYNYKNLIVKLVKFLYYLTSNGLYYIFYLLKFNGYTQIIINIFENIYNKKLNEWYRLEQ